MRNTTVPRRRRALGLTLSGLIAVTLGLAESTANAVPPAPPNPSDARIVESQGQVHAQVATVGSLINEVAALDAQVRALDGAMARRREEVNKALVDLQQARADAAQAEQALTQSTQKLTAAGTQINQAKHDFDTFATQAYTRPGAGSLIRVLGSSDPHIALDQAQVIALATKNQRQVLDRLHRAQLEEANAHSAARAAKTAADAATRRAQERKAAAEDAVHAVTAEIAQHAQERTELVRRRDQAKVELDAARSTAAGLRDQREAFVAWDQQYAAEREALLAAAAAAAARVAADQAARDRAERLGAGHRQHTELQEQPRSGADRAPTRQSRPQVRGAEAIDIVVDRAMSQLGVTYAWGGGDEAGPTLGIRDGGVGDWHGDYDKVGFDCSGLMMYAFAGIGVSLPHYSGYQYHAGTRIPVTKRQRGDMLFWGPGGSEHVALYLGGGKMVEAPQSGDVVKVSPVREGGIMPYAVRIVT